MPLTYPPSVTTDAQKVGYLLNVQERLRLIHNAVGYWYKPAAPDLTQYEYDNGILASKLSGTVAERIKLPAALKAQVPYRAKIGKTVWEAFLSTWWEPRNQRLMVELHERRAAVREDRAETVDLEGV